MGRVRFVFVHSIVRSLHNVLYLQITSLRGVFESTCLACSSKIVLLLCRWFVFISLITSFCESFEARGRLVDRVGISWYTSVVPFVFGCLLTTYRRELDFIFQSGYFFPIS